MGVPAFAIPELVVTACLRCPCRKPCGGEGESEGKEDHSFHDGPDANTSQCRVKVNSRLGTDLFQIRSDKRASGSELAGRVRIVTTE